VNLNNIKLIISACNVSQIPQTDLLEVVMAGRSNVGKSSLINVLLNRKNFARTSSTPGKTAAINFYDVDGTFMLVDLPGYGYAKVSKEKSKNWSELIEEYLNNAESIGLVIQLVDIRHKPSDGDKLMTRWLLGNKKPFIVVATKCDKLPKSGVLKQIDMIKEELHITDDAPLIPFSAQTRDGREQIWDFINHAIEKNTEDLL
jgi:GTP-binding protein